MTDELHYTLANAYRAGRDAAGPNRDRVEAGLAAVFARLAMLAETPAQASHTPRTAPQTLPGGTESGEGAGGAQRVFFGGDDERQMWTWECLDGHVSEFGDEPTETEACDALARHRAEEHAPSSKAAPDCSKGCGKEAGA